MADAADQIQLDPNVVAARAAARWQRIVAQLVEENAQLEAYVSELLAERQQKPPTE